MDYTLQHKQTTKHEFALYYKGLSLKVAKHCNGDQFLITDSVLIQRIVSVLRMNCGDLLILFDELLQLHTTITQILKRSEIGVVIVSKLPTTRLFPALHAFVPLLKRDETDEMVYGLTEVGVTSISLLTTHKVHRSWGGEREKERLERVVIAAAEQSKHFLLPQITDPCSLQAAITQSAYPIFLCDPMGDSFYESINALKANKKPEGYRVFVGPEGDFTQEEKEFLIQSGAHSIRLTPTVLRASHAAIISIAMIRSFYN